MPKIRSRKKGKGAPRPDETTPGLERRFWRNWYLLLGVTVATTIGLTAALQSVHSGRIAIPWPWVKTEAVLLGTLSLFVCAYAVYLTIQQRRLVFIRRRSEHLEEQGLERAQRDHGRLLALLNVSRLMGTDSDPQQVFDCIANMCVEIFECEQTSVMLANRETNELEVRAATGHLNLAEVLSTRQSIGEGIAGWVAARMQPLLLTPPIDWKRYPGLRTIKRFDTAAMVVPIISDGKLVGVLNVTSRSPKIRYDEDDLNALQVFAENAGACIHHAERFERMKRINDGLRTALARYEQLDKTKAPLS